MVYIMSVYGPVKLDSPQQSLVGFTGNQHLGIFPFREGSLFYLDFPEIRVPISLPKSYLLEAKRSCEVAG